MTERVSINDKAAEFRANAASCGLEPKRGPQMDAYVTNSINGNGTWKHDNSTPIMSAKEASCMKIPGSAVDEPTAASKLGDWLKKSYADAVSAVGQSLEDRKAELNGGMTATCADAKKDFEAGKSVNKVAVTYCGLVQ